MTKRSKEAMKKAKEAEVHKMKDQQDGIFEKCQRPTFTEVLNGEVADCKIKPFTQRRCPPCSSHRRTVASSLASKQRAARSKIEQNIIKLNARQLLKDKEILLQTNSELSEEMRKTKIAYHNSIQQNITTSKALEEWKLSHNQLQAGIQTLQNNILQLESLIKNLQHRDATISYYSTQQSREADLANEQVAFLRAQRQQQHPPQFQPQLQQQPHQFPPQSQQQQQHQFQLPHAHLQ